MTQSELKTHVTVMGVLFLLSGLFFLVAGAFLLMLFFGIGVVSQDLTAFGVLGTIGTVAAGAMLLTAIPGLAAAYGLLRGRKWGRVAGIVVGAIFLFHFPIGTLIGLYAIVVLANDAARIHFEERTPAVAVVA